MNDIYELNTVDKVEGADLLRLHSNRNNSVRAASFNVLDDFFSGPNKRYRLQGWSPAYKSVLNGAKQALQLYDWVGGSGDKPTDYIGQYIASTGFVTDINLATDFMPSAGHNGWTPVLSVVNDGERRVLQLIDYAGGTGTKPTSNINGYVSATGYTSIIANAVDIRGTQGTQGASYPQATDQNVIAGTSTTPMLYSPEQLKLAAQIHGGAVKNIPFANITSAPDLTATSTVIFGDLTGNAVTPTPTNGVIGKTYDFIWHQDETGGRSVTFDGVDYGSGAAGTYMTKSFKCVATSTFVLVGGS